MLAATSTATAEVEYALLLVFYGVLGYWLAVSTRRRIGTTPWRLPPMLWAFVSALLPLLGLMVEMVARFTTRHVAPGAGFTDRVPFGLRRGNGFDARGVESARTDVRPGAQGPYGSFDPYGAAPEPPLPANPAGGSTPWPANVSVRPGPGGWTPSPPGEVNPLGPPPLFGWYPDPENQHEERYWDGRMWDDHVRDDGVSSVAPLAPSPAPGTFTGTAGDAEAGISEGTLDDAEGTPEDLGHVETDDSRPEP